MKLPRFAIRMLLLAATVSGAVVPASCFGTPADFALSRHLAAVLAADTGDPVSGAPPPSSRETEPVQKPAVPSVAAFLSYQRTVREEIITGRRFKHLDNESRNRLLGAQDELFALLEGKISIEELDAAEQVAVYNAQGVVNAVLADAELDREICKRERTLGSHRVMTVCMTVREQEEMRRLSQDDLRKRRAKGCGREASLHGGGAMQINCGG